MAGEGGVFGLAGAGCCACFVAEGGVAGLASDFAVGLFAGGGVAGLASGFAVGLFAGGCVTGFAGAGCAAGSDGWVRRSGEAGVGFVRAVEGAGLDAGWAGSTVF
ncbi:MAG: hypothetical protein WA239_25785, partial [Candidatus Sulfotelmatobacter sp.]